MFAENMQSLILQQQQYTIKIVDRLEKIPAAQWNLIVDEIPFYQSHEFLSIIESVQPNIDFRYVLIEQENKIVAAVYAQILDFSYKNLVNYNSSSSSYFKKKIKNYIAKKSTRLLNLGNVFFTGDTGIISKETDNIISLLPTVLNQITQTIEDRQPKAFLIANIDMQLENSSKCFSANNYHPFITEPDLFLNILPQWNSFEDYMNSLSSKYKVRTRKILKVSEVISAKQLTLDELQFYKNDLEKLYSNVINHVAFNMATIKIDFFEQVKHLYEEKCTVIAYFLHEKIVSFVCLLHVNDVNLHVHYIGMDYEVNKPYKLYNRMLLDTVDLGIKKRMQQIHFGRTATEIKTTIGATPKPLKAYLKMSNFFLNKLLPYFLKRIQAPIFITRQPFK